MKNEYIEVLKLQGFRNPEILITASFDLQLFAAEDEGRTEDPTEYKKRKAREEGNIPKSQELTGIIVFLVGFWTISLLGQFIIDNLMTLMRYYMDNLITIRVSASEIPSMLTTMLSLSAGILLPMFLVGVVASVLGSIIQGGWIFTTKKLTFNFAKIFTNIGSNFAKMFWSREMFFNLGKSLAKVAGVFVIAFIILNNRLAEMLNMASMDMVKSLGVLWQIVFQFVTFSGILLLLFAVGDYAFQRYIHTESLKMTKQEIKDEFKEMEGNPEIKAKIREMERRLLSRRVATEVPKADVVITNPTHIAIAVKYDQAYMTAPVIVAKGEGTLAQRIKDIAKEHNIVIMENKPLARELYKRVEVGQEIPGDLFMAVAKVLSLVYQMRGGVAA